MNTLKVWINSLLTVCYTLNTKKNETAFNCYVIQKKCINIYEKYIPIAFVIVGYRQALSYNSAKITGLSRIYYN